jgi:hypothetical protein
MYERDDIDRRDETETETETEARLEHAARCGCLECDPDLYFDPAELGDDRCAA